MWTEAELVSVCARTKGWKEVLVCTIISVNFLSKAKFRRESIKVNGISLSKYPPIWSNGFVRFSKVSQCASKHEAVNRKGVIRLVKNKNLDLTSTSLWGEKNNS